MENGLTNDGFVGGYFHVTANYAAGDGNCFIAQCISEEGFDYECWDRMPLQQAIEQGCTIIQCHHCDKPAISIDNHWPYMSEMNYCEDHRPARKSTTDKEK